MASWGGKSGDKPTTRGGSLHPKRLLVWYTPNGNYDAPTPAFSGMWAPLAKHKNKITFVTGVDLKSQGVWHVDGEPHQFGMCLLTGRRPNPGNFVGGDGSTAGWGSGISVDQAIAAQIGQDTPFRTLNPAVQPGAATEVRSVMSYTGSDEPVPNEANPVNFFDTVFSEVGQDPQVAALLRARRKSVLDAAATQFQAINARLGAEDRKKLEHHLDSVREVERNVQNIGGTIGKCDVPDSPDGSIDIANPASMPVIGKAHIDLLVRAFACDLTRVATLQWSASSNNRPYPWLKVNGQPIMDDEHALGHIGPNDPPTWAKLVAIKVWYNEQFSYLLDQLAAVPEGEGTLLDNTLVMMVSEISWGYTHSSDDLVFMLAGGAGGAMKTGQIVNFPGDKSHNDLLVTVMNAMGVEATSFGDPAYNSGPMSELLV
jgi:hypothetical protein